MKHGSIYSNPAHRSIDGQELPQEYLQDGEFDRLIQEVSRLLLACRQLLIRPMVFSDGIDFDVITPDKFTVLPGTRRGKAEAIVYKIGEEFIYWDSKKQAKLSHSFKVLDETINPAFTRVCAETFEGILADLRCESPKSLGHENGTGDHRSQLFTKANQL